MEISKDQKFTILPEVLFQEVSGEMVLLDLASENYFGLDEIGARIWGLLESSSSIGDAMDILSEEYEVGRDVLEKDVRELLDKLLDAGLIQQWQA